MKILVVNSGSTSLKYALFSGSTREQAGKVERLNEKEDGHTHAINELLESLDGSSIDAVAHRVVHGGANNARPALIDDATVEQLEALVPLAPLHNPPNIAGIRAARRALPDIPHVAVFDTSFHHTLPRRAKHYAIDPEAHSAVRRYGFHGPSHACIAQRAAEHLGRDPRELRTVSLHLGGGCSACAIEYGRSVETSMGMTPLEGLVMSTRAGDIDAGVVLRLARELGIEETETLLNRDGGLKGLSGISGDLRDLEMAAAEGHDRARLAINVFAHQARKYVGAYAAAMGGVDVIAFTAGIGENSVSMRRRILQRLEFLGVHLDEDRNRDAAVSQEHPVREISAQGSRVRALVVKTDEEWMLAEATRALLQKSPPNRKPIPIAVSARHIHLTREAMDALFGKGSELEELHPLSQPGQFASKQTLTLVGPKAKIEDVRVLGPLRRACQIEISRTDEFKLGVDAPVRHSGKVKGSAPITLVGPSGTLKLDEGLICAWRHIHMTPADADEYGVKDGDEVQVAITGGERDLVFGDVLVRVKDSYRLEMHIDTDEANAAELGRSAEGALVYTAAPDHEAIIRE